VADLAKVKYDIVGVKFISRETSFTPTSENVWRWALGFRLFDAI